MPQSFLDNSIGFITNRTAVRLQGELERTFVRHGYEITAPQWMVLTRLWEENGLSQNEIANRTFKDKTNIARILALLERNQLLVRKRSETDQRFHQIYLTEAGQLLHKQLMPLAREVLTRAQQGLQEEQVYMLINLLNQVYTNLE